jgi:hypothetical protein
MASSSPTSTRRATPRRIVLLSQEFLDPLFSGNGVYARSLVRALRAGGSRVLVLGGCSDDAAAAAAAAGEDVAAVPLPAATWTRLDCRGGWAPFAAGAAAAAARLRAFAPDVALAVDWHGVYWGDNDAS